uniref:Uncharacterized protein n=1 Tax=Glossina palpalis gambiensis TaxID=67801 RepID=A0A1B0BJS0_9MUSC
MKNHWQLCTFFTYQCGCGQQPRHYYRDGLFSHQNAIVYAGHHPSSIRCVFLLLGVTLQLVFFEAKGRAYNLDQTFATISKHSLLIVTRWSSVLK